MAWAEWLIDIMLRVLLDEKRRIESWTFTNFVFKICRQQAMEFVWSLGLRVGIILKTVLGIDHLDNKNYRIKLTLRTGHINLVHPIISTGQVKEF